MTSGLWRRGVVVITTAQLHSTKPELRFCAGSNPARGVTEIRLEIMLNTFRWSTIPQKKFIIIIIIIIIWKIFSPVPFLGSFWNFYFKSFMPQTEICFEQIISIASVENIYFAIKISENIKCYFIWEDLVYFRTASLSWHQHQEGACKIIKYMFFWSASKLIFIDIAVIAVKNGC